MLLTLAPSSCFLLRELEIYYKCNFLIARISEYDKHSFFQWFVKKEKRVNCNVLGITYFSVYAT